MRKIRKPFALIVAFTLLLSLCACQKKQSNTSHTEDQFNNTANTVGATNPTEPTQQQKKLLSSDALIANIRWYGTKNGYGTDFLSDVKTEAGESAGEKKISFTYYKGYASVIVTEIDNIVQTIMVTALPAKFAQLTPSNSSTENLHQAYAVCLVMLEACESDKDGDWHVEQLGNAQNEGNSSVSIGSYTSDEWHYTGMLSDYYVTCVAARYCSQCKTNAPKVTFSTGAVTCDRCNYGSQEDNNTSHGGSASNSETTFNSGSTSNSGNTSQQPASCSHNYANATCTTPKTCTLCGQTSGSALNHSYSAATCTEPQTCSRCGATTGSAAGHTWKNATCTEPAICTTCHETWGTAKGHSWKDATCSAPKTCQTCKTTEGSALPHNMHYTICTMCDHTDFSEYTLTSNTFCLDSWFNLGDGSGSQYLEDGEASINIDSNGVCKVTFDKYSYTFTLVQSEVDVHGLHFKCYMNGEQVKNTEITFFFSQNRCDFFNYGDTLGFSQVALNFDM